MSRPAHPRVAEVADLLAVSGAAGQVRELSGSARTAAEAAAQLGVPVGAIANSLLFDVDGSPLLVLTSGGHRVDEVHVAGLLGVSHVARASADFVRRHTGMPIGGVAPIGHPEPIGTLVDVELSRYEHVWASAGHPSAVFRSSYEELLRLTAGTAAEVGGSPIADDSSPDVEKAVGP
jgi:prolyl-tRNA editing enzyme YbaK/EbsC (Cys-tRNA(Pro) deacylase)